MARIALCHFRVGETDGVSLEMEKWKIVLEALGHRVFFLSGSSKTQENHRISQLHYKDKPSLDFLSQAYQTLTVSEDTFKKKLADYSNHIREILVSYIRNQQIDILIPNNIFSLGYGLPAAIAIKQAIDQTGIRCICHHHDFYWERDAYSKPTCDTVKNLLQDLFPPAGSRISHVVINSLARDELLRRKQIESTVVPNVFDFNQPPWKKDAYNSDFRSRIGVSEHDILVLQATRIAERKAIELSIDFIQSLQDKQRFTRLQSTPLYDGRNFGPDNTIKLVLAGLKECSDTYLETLIKRAEKASVNLVFANHVIDAGRRMEPGSKIYSLWDSYVHADLVTYPSILEGWGNQFLEAVFAKKPVMIYEYPVYEADLKQHKFYTVSLGNRHTINPEGLVTIKPERMENAADKAIRVLTDSDIYRDITQKNYRIACAVYSYQNLENLLKNLIS